MMAEYTLHFLGPTGTFTHQAAIEAAKTIRPSGASVTLTPEPDVPTILDAVQRRGGLGHHRVGKQRGRVRRAEPRRAHRR